MAKLTFYYASMNSGKSLSLITKHHMLTNRGFNVVVVKPSIDDRSINIETRLGPSIPAIQIDSTVTISSKILNASNVKPDYILCDEAQFFSKEQIWDLAGLVDNWNINIICYGLRIDWKGNFFTGSEELMKISDELLPIENICKVEKGANAFFHMKLTNLETDGPDTGFEDKYSSVSRKTWKQWYDTIK